MSADNACGKRRYPTKNQALTTGLRALRKPGNETVDLRAYRCPKCKGWHLTSKTDRKAERPGGGDA